jgi:hypothetical protein
MILVVLQIGKRKSQRLISTPTYILACVMETQIDVGLLNQFFFTYYPVFFVVGISSQLIFAP